MRSVAIRKLQPKPDADQNSGLLESLSAFEVVSTDSNLVLDAHQHTIQEQLTWFDALIAEATIRILCPDSLCRRQNPRARNHWHVDC